MSRLIQLASDEANRTIKKSSYWNNGECSYLNYNGILFNQTFVKGIYYMNGSDLTCVYEDSDAPTLVSSSYKLVYSPTSSVPTKFETHSSEKEPIAKAGSETYGPYYSCAVPIKYCKYKLSNSAYDTITYVGAKPDASPGSAIDADLYVDDVKMNLKSGIYQNYAVPENTVGHGLWREVYFYNPDVNLKTSIFEVQTGDEYALFGLSYDYYDATNVSSIYEAYYESINEESGDTWTKSGDHSYSVKLGDQIVDGEEAASMDDATPCSTFMIRPLQKCKLEITSPYGWAWVCNETDCYSALDVTDKCTNFYENGGTTPFNGLSQSNALADTSALSDLGTFSKLSDTAVTLDLEPGSPVIIGVCDNASFTLKSA